MKNISDSQFNDAKGLSCLPQIRDNDTKGKILINSYAIEALFLPENQSIIPYIYDHTLNSENINLSASLYKVDSTLKLANDSKQTNPNFGMFLNF